MASSATRLAEMHLPLAVIVIRGTDGERVDIAVSRGENAIRVYNAATKQLEWTLESHEEHVTCLAAADDGTMLVSAARDGSVCVWSTSRLQKGPVRGLQLGDAVHALAIAGGGSDVRRLAAGGKEKLCVWELGTDWLGTAPAERQRLKDGMLEPMAPIRALAFTPDGRTLVSGGEDKAILVWGLERGDWTFQKRLEGHTGPVRSLAIACDGRLLFSGGDDRTVRRWDLSGSWRQLAQTTPHVDVLSGIALAHDGYGVFSWSRDRTIKRWGPSGGEWETSDVAATPDPVAGLSVSKSGTIVVLTTTTEGSPNSCSILLVTVPARIGLKDDDIPIHQWSRPSQAPNLPQFPLREAASGPPAVEQESQIDILQPSAKPSPEGSSLAARLLSPHSARGSVGSPRVHKVAVRFQMQYKTNPAQQLYICGDIKELGQWKQPIKLKLKEGHLWTAEISIPQACSKFEYKYVFGDSGGKLCWETGAHRIGRVDSQTSSKEFAAVFEDKWDREFEESQAANDGPVEDVRRLRIVEHSVADHSGPRASRSANSSGRFSLGDRSDLLIEKQESRGAEPADPALAPAPPVSSDGDGGGRKKGRRSRQWRNRCGRDESGVTTEEPFVTPRSDGEPAAEAPGEAWAEPSGSGPLRPPGVSSSCDGATPDLEKLRELQEEVRRLKAENERKQEDIAKLKRLSARQVGHIAALKAAAYTARSVSGGRSSDGPGSGPLPWAAESVVAAHGSAASPVTASGPVPPAAPSPSTGANAVPPGAASPVAPLLAPPAPPAAEQQLAAAVCPPLASGAVVPLPPPLLPAPAGPIVRPTPKAPLVPPLALGVVPPSPAGRSASILLPPGLVPGASPKPRGIASPPPPPPPPGAGLAIPPPPIAPSPLAASDPVPPLRLLVAPPGSAWFRPVLQSTSSATAPRTGTSASCSGGPPVAPVAFGGVLPPPPPPPLYAVPPPPPAGGGAAPPPPPAAGAFPPTPAAAGPWPWAAPSPVPPAPSMSLPPGVKVAVAPAGAVPPARKVIEHRTQLRRFFWQEIVLPSKIAHSIWSSLKEEDVPLEGSDLQGLRDSFTAVALDAAPRRGAVSLLGFHTASRCEIMLSQFRMTFPKIREALMAMDERALDEARVDLEQVARFLPTDEEAKKLQSFKGREEELCKGDRFLREMLRVPRFQPRLDAWISKRRFEERMPALRSTLADAAAAARELLASRGFAHVLHVVLVLGNTLNGRASYGFRLECLVKLHETRTTASSRKSTLLGFIVAFLEGKAAAKDARDERAEKAVEATAKELSKDPAEAAASVAAEAARAAARALGDINVTPATSAPTFPQKGPVFTPATGAAAERLRAALGFASELPSLERASKGNLKTAEEELNQLEKDLSDVERESAAYPADLGVVAYARAHGRHADKFPEVIAAFLASARRALEDAKEKLAVARELFRALSIYLGDEMPEKSPDEFLHLLSRFAGLFEAARREVAAWKESTPKRTEDDRKKPARPPVTPAREREGTPSLQLGPRGLRAREAPDGARRESNFDDLITPRIPLAEGTLVGAAAVVAAVQQQAKDKEARGSKEAAAKESAAAAVAAAKEAAAAREAAAREAAAVRAATRASMASAGISIPRPSSREPSPTLAASPTGTRPRVPPLPPAAGPSASPPPATPTDSGGPPKLNSTKPKLNLGTPIPKLNLGPGLAAVATPLAAPPPAAPKPPPAAEAMPPPQRKGPTTLKAYAAGKAPAAVPQLPVSATPPAGAERKNAPAVPKLALGLKTPPGGPAAVPASDEDLAAHMRNVMITIHSPDAKPPRPPPV